MRTSTIALLAWAATLPATVAAARTVHVDATGTACPGAEYTTIQEALDASPPGTTIAVCAGTYAEQLVVTTRVKLVGVGSPVIRPGFLTKRTTSLRTGHPIAAVVEVAGPATVDGFEIDGSGNGLGRCDADDPQLVGVFFRGTSGVLRNSRVTGVHHPAPAGACDSGVAVLVQADGKRSIRVTVSANTIDGYQRAGIVVNEPRARAVVASNVVIGDGSAAMEAQNGIQVGFGATAVVVGNTVTDNTGPSGGNCAFDSGNLSFQADRGVIKNNTFRGNTAAVLVSGSRNKILANMIDGRSGSTPVGLDGISVAGDRNVVTANTVYGVSEVGIRLSGNGNVARRNSVSATHEDPVCAAVRSLPGCAAILPVCGVGLWIVDGTGNVDAHNALFENDVPERNDSAPGDRASRR